MFTIISFAIFVGSSALLFRSRYEKNELAMAIAGLVALASFGYLTYELKNKIWPPIPKPEPVMAEASHADCEKFLESGKQLSWLAADCGRYPDLNRRYNEKNKAPLSRVEVRPPEAKTPPERP
jgi:hypothetical protein